MWDTRSLDVLDMLFADQVSQERNWGAVVHRWFRPVRICGLLLILLHPSSTFGGQRVVNSGATKALDAAPEFEIASVRESAPAAEFRQRLLNEPQSGAFIAVNLWLSQLIAEAYDVSFQHQVENVPPWIKDKRFDVNARASDALVRQLQDLPDQQAKSLKRQLLKKLLADRFGLTVDITTKELPGEVISVGKRSLKLHLVSKPQDPEQSGIFTSAESRGIRLEGRGATIDSLQKMLSFYLKKSVRNDTQLSGAYDFLLEFNGTFAKLNDESGDRWPPLETAIQDQLGLKVDLRNLPTTVIEVRRVSMPTPN